MSDRQVEPTSDAPQTQRQTVDAASQRSDNEYPFF